MEDSSLSSKINGLTTQTSSTVQEPEELAPPAWRDEEVDKIINKFTPAEDKPKITGALLGMLGSVRTKTQRQNPHQPPIRDDIRDGDIIPKSDLLQHSDDGFHLDDLINHPDADPQYRDKSTVGSNEHLLVDVHGSDTLQKEIRRVLDKYKKKYSLQHSLLNQQE